jgi:hypothetical protein
MRDGTLLLLVALTGCGHPPAPVGMDASATEAGDVTAEGRSDHTGGTADAGSDVCRGVPCGPDIACCVGICHYCPDCDVAATCN